MQNYYGYNPAFMAQHYEISRVAGQQGASQFPMAPNSSILLLDDKDPIVWFVQTDAGGYKKDVIPYKITPYEPPKQVDYSELDERIKRLEAMLNGKSNFRPHEQQTDESTIE